jgi:hypothetical protein
LLREPRLVRACGRPCIDFLNRHLCFSVLDGIVLDGIHDIILVFNIQNIRAVEPDMDKRLILPGKPESVDLLVLTHKVSSFNPKRQFLRRMLLDSHHGVVVSVNLQFALKQMLVLALGTACATKQ